MATQEEMALEMAKAAAGSVGKESVNKLIAAIGGFFPFFGLKHKAVSTYVEDIQKSDLPPEAKMMAIANAKKTYKQLKNQMAIAEIAQNAARDGTDFSMQSGVDDEWLERFMDSAKFVSNEKVQLLWGNILAREFETPNSTPPSIIRVLSEITPSYAKAFQVLCSLKCVISLEDGYSEDVLILPKQFDYLQRYGVSFQTPTELEMLGLIQIEGSGGFVKRFKKSRHKKVYCTYGEDRAVITDYPEQQFPTGIVYLTSVGNLISTFVTTEYIDGHFKAVCDYFRHEHCEVYEQKED